MSQEQTTKLQPCPFCGGLDLRVDDDETEQSTSIPENRWVVCNNCDARGPCVLFVEDESAEEQWNARPLLTSGQEQTTNPAYQLECSKALRVVQETKANPTEQAAYNLGYLHGLQTAHYLRGVVIGDEDV